MGIFHRYAFGSRLARDLHTPGVQRWMDPTGASYQYALVVALATSVHIATRRSWCGRRAPPRRKVCESLDALQLGPTADRHGQPADADTRNNRCLSAARAQRDSTSAHLAARGGPLSMAIRSHHHRRVSGSSRSASIATPVAEEPWQRSGTSSSGSV